MGGLHILVNNAAYQNMTNGIDELIEYVKYLIGKQDCTDKAKGLMGQDL